MTNSFRGLFVWEASVDLSIQIIALCDALVTRRMFVIADQMTRAAISVPSNIAEGEGRLTNGDRRHYLVQARGSLYELETQLEIVSRAGLVTDIAGLRDRIAKIGIGLTRMIQYRGSQHNRFQPRS